MADNPRESPEPPEPASAPQPGGQASPATRARRRVPTWLAGLVVLVVLGSGVAVVQVRAARAADTRAAAERAATAAQSSQAAAAQTTQLAAERATAVTAVDAQIATADPVLAGSSGKVADDAVRQSLATAITAARTAMAATTTSAADLTAAGTAVDSARTAVEAAQAAWQQATDAAAAAAAAARSVPAPTKPPAAGTTAAAGSSSAAIAAAAAAAKAKAAAAGAPVFVTSVPTAEGDGSNGHMPMSSMCLVPWGTDQIGSPQYLRCDAEAALTRLNDAFRAHFGDPIAMDLTYRSYADQVKVAAYYGSLAATPGTSTHGLGIALDVQEWPTIYGFGTARYTWLVANGPTYGWFAPANLRQTAAYPEYWHFEYGPGRTS
jgi:D-alanyl-D-alanine carboxypeptidase